MGFISLIKSLFIRKAILRFHSIACTYDGRRHSVSYDAQGISKDHKVELLTRSCYIHATNETIAPSVGDIRITSNSGKDVTGLYSLDIIPGTVVIKPAELRASSASKSKTYDGTALVDNEVSIEGLIEDETVAVIATGSITHVGSAANTIDINWGRSSALRSDYVIKISEGTLTVSPASMHVSAPDTTVVYDGKPHAPVVNAPNDAKIIYNGPSMFIDAGTYSASYIVTKPNFDSVTGTARLTISPAFLMVGSRSSTKTYDGKLLTAPTVHSNGLAHGETIIAYATGAIRDVGTATNSIKIDWNNSTAKESNYSTIFSPGTLTVLSAPLEVRSHVVSAIYDGNPHFLDVDAPQGATIEFEGPSCYIEPGSYEVPFTASHKNHAPTSGIAALTIKPARITLVSGSKTKAYDGQPLECPDIQIFGLVEGESLIARTIGTITDVGTVQNEVEIDWDASTAHRSDYTLDFELGTLAVEPAPLELEYSDTIVLYDGGSHLPHIEIPKEASLRYFIPAIPIHVGSYNIGFTATMPNHSPASGIARLIIKPAPLFISSQSASKQYDGAALSAPLTHVEGLVPTDALVAKASGNITDVGEIENDIVIDWDASTARQDDYEITLRLGTLSVTPAPLEVQANPSTIIYDGADHFYNIEVPSGACVSFENEEKVHAVGSYQTKYRVTKPNHQVFEGTAQLEVIEFPDPIIVAVEGGDFEYNGVPHQAIVRVPQLPAGYHLVEASASSTITHVNESPVIVSCDSLKIENIDGEDVTERLNIVYSDARLAVYPKPLYVLTYDAHRSYTGKPLTTGGKLSGLCEDETVTFKITGSQTDQGESENTYAIAFNGTALESDYQIVEDLGRLRVLPPKPQSTAAIKPGSTSRTTEPRRDASPIVAPTNTGTPKQPGHNVPLGNNETHSRRPAQAMPSISFPESNFNQRNYSEIEWTKPKVRIKGESDQHDSAHASFERKRAYSARTVSLRDSIEDAGLGHNFKPYDFEAPSLDHKKKLKSTLRDIEASAASCIDSLLKSNKDLLLYECFADGIEDESAFVRSFRELFATFSYDQRLSIAYIHRYNFHSFMLLVALLARNGYDGQTLWKNVFDQLGLRNSDAQNKFKQMFISFMFQKGLVTYQREKSHTYIAYTALLHGGFSQAIWEDLWSHSFMPLAKKKALPRSSSGTDILDTLLYDSAYMPRLSITKQLLKSAPRSALASPFEEALATAYSAYDQWSQSEVTFVSSQKLSPEALNSLGSYPRTANRSLAGDGMPVKSNRSPVLQRKTILAAKDMELSLDTTKGTVQLAWSAQAAPSTMMGYIVELYANGKLIHTDSFGPDVGGCCLPANSIELDPCEQYDIERIIKKPTDDGAEQEVASLRQSFHKSKPYCFEFIRRNDGGYVFRKPEKSLTKTHRIAYLVPSYIGVRGVHGMTFIGSIPAQSSWSQMTIYTYDVEAGASGELIDLDTNQVLSGWNENYRVRINKDNVIGNIGTMDVYGHMLGTGETDVALPSISIDTLARQAAEDVEVRFIRNGERSMLDAIFNLNDEDDSGSLSLSFPSSDLGRGVADSCIIEARQQSTEDLLLRYRFAIVPIQGFRLEDYKISPTTGELIGIYELSVTEPVAIRYNINEGIERNIEAGAASNVEAPLKLEAVRTYLEDSRGSSIEFDLHLAGVDVQVPEPLQARARQLPFIGYPSAKTLGFTSGDIRVCAKGRRRGRRVKVMLGSLIIGEKDFDREGSSPFSIFANAEVFAPIPEERYVSMPLTLHISFGRKMEHGSIERGIASYKLLECGKGLEFTVCEIRATAKDGTCLCFDNKYPKSIPSCNMKVSFYDSRNRLIAAVDASKGNRIVKLPPDVRDLYDRRRSDIVSLAVTSGFGVIDQNHPAIFTFCKARLNGVKR